MKKIGFLIVSFFVLYGVWIELDNNKSSQKPGCTITATNTAVYPNETLFEQRFTCNCDEVLELADKLNEYFIDKLDLDLEFEIK